MYLGIIDFLQAFDPTPLALQRRLTSFSAGMGHVQTGGALVEGGYRVCQLRVLRPRSVRPPHSRHSAAAGLRAAS